MKTATLDLSSYIKDVPDFPKKGIVFKDMTPLLADAAAFAAAIDCLSEPFIGKGINVVAGIESRGFLLATPIAYRLNAGVVPLRKKGKLPRQTISANYILEYGEETMEAHADAIRPDSRVLLVDDVLATGGTAEAACRLIEKLRGKIEGVAFLMELKFLNGRRKLDGRPIRSLLSY